MYVRTLIASNPNWLDVLVSEYKINAARCSVDNHLISLKYNQLESPMHEPIVQECRGMVVNTNTNQVLAFPMKKFWNHGEHLAALIDWQASRVQAKCDGSLMILYWDSDINNWRVASSGHPTAGGTIYSQNQDPNGANGQTFRDLFWQTFTSLGMQLPAEDILKDSTYCFELQTPANRIVVRHETNKLTCLTARINRDNCESEWQRPTLELICKELNWPIVDEYPLASIEDCLAAAEALDPIQAEGFVVVDSNFNRVKIKSPRYVALHHLRSAFSTRRVIELWQIKPEEIEELTLYFPELRPDILKVTDILDKVIFDCFNDFVTHKNAPTRKDFATAVKDKPWSAVLFKLHSESVENQSADTVKNILKKMTVPAMERLLERLVSP